MSWSFHPGQRVVCISNDRRILCAGESVSIPTKGVIYTIERVGFGRHPLTQKRSLGLTLIELPLPVRSWCFSGTAFRPVDEARLDQFRAHLAPAPRSPVAA